MTQRIRTCTRAALRGGYFCLKQIQCFSPNIPAGGASGSLHREGEA